MSEPEVVSIPEMQGEILCSLYEKMKDMDPTSKEYVQVNEQATKIANLLQAESELESKNFDNDSKNLLEEKKLKDSKKERIKEYTIFGVTTATSIYTFERIFRNEINVGPIATKMSFDWFKKIGNMFKR